MVEFNPDGSIKLSTVMQKNKEQKINKLQNEYCVLVTKEIISTYPPKSCKLSLKLSDKIKDNRFIVTIHNYFSQEADTPMKLIEKNPKEFEIEVGTSFRRCSECSKLIGKYREWLDGNIVVEKGTCTYEPAESNPNFCYEDHFD